MKRISYSMVAKTLGIAAALLITVTSASAQAGKKSPPKPSAPKAAAKAPSAPGHATPQGVSHTGSAGASGHATPNAAGGHGTPNTAGATTHGPGGTTTTRAANGSAITKGPNGRVTSYKGANGSEAKFGSNGRVKEVKANGMTIHHGPTGTRRVTVDRPDHSRLVSEGHGRGYIQKPYMYHGHAYVNRTYYRNGVAYRGYYRPYYYHGVYLQGYAYPYYYPAAYYGWAYNPWATPVAYGWGWGGAPWYGYYGGYFAPYPVYPAPSYWLTDYLIAASLTEAYQAGVAAGAAQQGRMNEPNSRGGAHLVLASWSPNGMPGGAAPALTPEVKKAIAEELERDIAAEEAAAKSGGGDDAPSAGLTLDDGKPHVFVVDNAVEVTDASGQSCNLTESDVLQLSTPPSGDATAASMQVLASKGEDCAKGAVVQVQLTDLQEMKNHLLATMDKGLGELHSKAGTGGLPNPPAAAKAPGTEAGFVSAAPPADPNGAQELDQQSQEAATTEQQVLAEAGTPDAGNAAPAVAAAPAAAPAGPPVTIALGQTPAQVTASKGAPKQIVKLGTKQIYVYSDMKIIFMNGKVSDVQ